MSSSEFREYNINDLTMFISCGESFAFNEFDWELLNGAGPSQPYMGADVQGDLGNYPEFPTPTTAPISLYPTHGVSPIERHHSPFYQGAALPSFSLQPEATHPSLSTSPFVAVSPVPTLLHGSWPHSPESRAMPITPTHHPHTQPQDIPNPDDMGFDFLTTAGNPTLPAVHSSPVYDPFYGELWPQCSQSGPLDFGSAPFDSVTGVAPPEITLPTPVASSSGPRRTRQLARGTERYNPTKPAKRNTGSKKDGWDRTLDRFRAEFNRTLPSIQDGQPSGGLIPEKALARIDELIKDDLKRSPLQGTKAGEGKRSRDVEDYLKGLLGAICRVGLASIPTGGKSNEDNTTAMALSRLADELEAKLVAVNQQPALRQLTGRSKPAQRTGNEQEKKVKKGRFEKGRRDREWYHLDRISRLFKAPRQLWSKKEVLSLAVLFLLYGSGAFPHDFVEVRHIAPGL